MSAILVRPASQIPARSDVELLARVVSGEIGALGELYDRYARDVWRVAQRMLGNADDAEDVVHLVFMKLPQIAASHDGRSNVRSWLLGVTVRIASRQRRGAGRFVKMIASFAQALSGVSQTDPERVVGAREELRAFETELAKLSPRKRDVFMLVEIEGLTSDEAARALGVPAATVRTRLHHARHQLAGSLSERDSREGEIMTDSCDRAWELDALREGRLGAKDVEAFERHLRTCGSCLETHDRDRRLRELARDLPKAEPPALEMRRLRARILRDVELRNPTAPAWRRKAGLAFAAAACAGAALFLHHRQTTTHDAPPVIAATAPSIASSSAVTVAEDSYAGAVVPGEHARWAQSREGEIEHVRLDDGTLQLHVRHQRADEHFFVDVPDGQIEVRGTTFRVEVRSGSTSRIDVSEGVVAVRIQGSSEMSLNAGQVWVRPAPMPTVPVAPVAHPSATGSSVVTPSSHPTSAADERASDQYAAAVALLQAGSYDAAARGFADFLSAHPSAAQSEDASYLEAASLARAGRPDAAALAAEQHLAAYPHSFHRKDAAILVARAARDRGDCAKAREILAPWLGNSPDSEAVATLRSCATN